jgi:aminodeoxyfutalosine synthase
MSSDLDRIARKVDPGERLTREEGLALFRTAEVHRLGRLADAVRRRRHGRKAYYVVNRHINYSNVCVDSCLFCAFARKRGREGAYEWDLEEIFRRAEDLTRMGATELHIVGGHHPDFPFSYYTGMIRGLKERHPGVTLKAFTAAEIQHFRDLFGMSVERILTELKEAGLGMLPGGGAEVFSQRVERKLFREKGDAQSWLTVHRTAHRLGLRSNATLLYGHIETDEEKVEHLLLLRGLQDQTGGFLSFIPLAFHPENTPMEKLPAPTGIDELRHVAVARLMLDNFEHVKAYWPMMGVATAQIALSYGADDIDGTVVEEKIYHMAGARTPQGVSVEDLERLILESGHEPVERDAFYNPVTKNGKDGDSIYSPNAKNIYCPQYSEVDNGNTG